MRKLSSGIHVITANSCFYYTYMNVDSGQACSQIGATGSDPLLKTVLDFKDAVWRFLRPHTIRGTALGST